MPLASLIGRLASAQPVFKILIKKVNFILNDCNDNYNYCIQYLWLIRNILTSPLCSWYSTRIITGSYFLQEKSDSSDGGKESSSEAGADGQDGSSSSSSKTKESSAGYEEKVVSTLQATLFELLFR